MKSFERSDPLFWPCSIALALALSITYFSNFALDVWRLETYLIMGAGLCAAFFSKAVIMEKRRRDESFWSHLQEYYYDELEVSKLARLNQRQFEFWKAAFIRIMIESLKNIGRVILAFGGY